jgi:hypothetical protein
MAVSMAMDLVGDVDRTPSGFGNGYFAFLLWLKIPNEVRILWVIDELLRGQWPLVGHESSYFRSPPILTG